MDKNCLVRNSLIKLSISNLLPHIGGILYFSGFFVLFL